MAIAIVASLALHIAVLELHPAPAATPPRDVTTAIDVAIEVEVERAPAAAPASPLPSIAAAPASRASAAATPRARLPAPPIAEASSEATAPRPAICEALADPSTRNGCLPPDAGPSIDTFRVLDPGAVARAAIDDGVLDGGVSAPIDEGERRGRALAAGLARAANVPAHLSERPPPELRRRRDGSYTYDSPQFEAIIAEDGTVTFLDRHVSMPAPLIFTFDVTDAVMRAQGMDPYVHERQWFMRETRELRERLAGAARERERAAGLRALEDRLARVWTDRSRPARERRAAIFEMWDDCADDAVGASARAIVVRFIQRHLPAGSHDAYGEAELAALNARRVSPLPFAPYG